ncbi:MAG: hypothetical protein H6602_01480 [Flavobacteriales bacterium]|nr:hypothetical protein [Flavobacteriales bacterium]MCB9190323.1 hypothetical protein [Flavobacteriales bacterium]
MTRPLAFLFLLIPFIAQAQTDMFGDEKVTKTDQEVYAEGAKEESKILIIPFEEKLFYCDIMRDLTTENQMSANEIYNRLRNEIQLSLKAALKDSMETATFLNTDSITDQDLINIYAVLGYKYVPVPVKEEVDEKGKVKKEKKQPEPQKEVGIRNGQVVAERQVVERYMSAQLKSFDVLNQFYTNYGINKFLFINQMDVKMDLSDPETAFIDPRRLVAIHYTIMGKDGKQISGGLASEQFPGTESRLNYIIGGNFYKLSAEVLNSLIVAEKKETESEMDNRKSKTKVEE